MNSNGTAVLIVQPFYGGGNSSARCNPKVFSKGDIYQEGKEAGVNKAVNRRLKRYTIDDIYALPDGECAELFDGQTYDVAPPAGSVNG